MNRTLDQSLEYASQPSYLSDLLRVYPVVSKDTPELFHTDQRQAFAEAGLRPVSHRRAGRMFGEWVAQGVFGLFPLSPQEFAATKANAILDTSTTAARQFAAELLHVRPGLVPDFIARFHGRLVAGEARCLTNCGTAARAQFDRAIARLDAPDDGTVRIAILDGTPYLPGNPMHDALTGKLRHARVMSALVMREFLYSI